MFDLSHRHRLAMQYLLSSLQDNGRFLYSRVFTGSELITLPGYNYIRHAGALLCLFPDVTVNLPERIYRARAELLENMEVVQLNGNQALAIVTGGAAKLGATALALTLVLADYSSSSDSQRTAHGLATFLALQQNSEGRFQSIFCIRGRQRDFESLYYPGEAILALTRAAKVLGASKYADSAVRGANYLANRYKQLPISDLPADHWLMLAIRELNEIRPNPDLCAIVTRLGDAIVNSAVRDETNKTAHWGADRRLCPAATRAEGLAVAVEICLESGKVKKALKFLQCLEQAIAFCIRHQIDDQFVKEAPETGPLLGGFFHSANNHTVRIDYVQHVMGAIRGLLRVRESSSKAAGRHYNRDSSAAL